MSDLTGATALTPMFAPSHGDDTHDVEAVEADAGTMVAGDAPLVGDDPNVQPGTETAAGEVVGGTPEADLGGEVLGPPGFETEHGDEANAVEGRHGDKEAIFSNRRAGIFFGIYYMMTGIHAIHIIIGIIAIGFLVYFAQKDRYSSVWYTPVENVGLYWHIVDIIWIFVFPLMYLI